MNSKLNDMTTNSVRFLQMESNIASIIENFSVEEGVNIWPCVRIASREVFKNRYTYQKSSLGVHSSLTRFRYELTPESRDRLLTYSAGSIFIDTHKTLYTRRVRDKAYNPYLDAVAIEAQKAGIPAVKVLIGNGRPFGNTLVPLTEIHIQKIQDDPLPFHKIPAVQVYAEYVESCLEYGVPALHLIHLLSFYEGVAAYAHLYQTVLGILQPQMVIMECYYAIPRQGLTLACHRLGIPSVDYQHGLQDYPHLAYNFNYLPATGFELMPKWFFTWGDRPTENLQKFFSAQQYHRAITAGNPDYIAWKNDDAPEEPELLNDFYRCIRGKIPICVALPFLWLPPATVAAFEAALERAPENWVWLFREHPLGHPSQHLNLAAAEHKIERTICTKLRLHTVLFHSRHLITVGSSVAFEALSLHSLQTTFLNESSKIPYKAFNGTRFHFANTANAILESIHNGLAAWPADEPAPTYVTRDTNLLRTAIRMVQADTPDCK